MSAFLIGLAVNIREKEESMMSAELARIENSGMTDLAHGLAMELARIENAALTDAARDLAEDWRAHLELQVKAGQMADDTAATYKRGFAKFQQWGQTRKTSGVAIDRTAVLDWIADLRTSGKSAKSISIWLSGARSFFQWGLSQGHFPADPTAGVKAGRRTNACRHSRDKLTDEEIARLLGLASLTTRNKALIWLALYTAARSVELWRADIEDLRTSGQQMLLYVQGKGHSEKDEPLVIAAKSARDAIRDYLAEMAEVGHRSGALFVTERKFNGVYQRISRRTLRRAVRNAFDAAGIIEPTKTAHSLRHSAISKIVETTGDIRLAQKVARHSSITTTEIYAHELDRLSNPGEAHIKFGLPGE